MKAVVLLPPPLQMSNLPQLLYSLITAEIPLLLRHRGYSGEVEAVVLILTGAHGIWHTHPGGITGKSLAAWKLSSDW